MTTPITFEVLGTILTIIATTVGVAIWIVTEIAKSRRDSQDGRRELYARIDQNMHEIAETYMRRDLHDAEMRAVQHSLQETNTILSNITNRVCPFEARPDPGDRPSQETR
ncbi:hypothetical protein F1188_10980 [Roseospira marina]|uniref:Uncharacterized protein n=1 Tax=Roseospira marina TaxID=140057 RepID=A0A5M6ICR5_9PROT|nr:hypothetical protein [Roseospira marina]KAA5605418.1 hypothetical protein F1188_10980 [Roseospira marina]MBB4314588.1 5-bromo-4-chloroindolyl phosphate hydrolysis protein [Roseospira marina]MBB5088850.1 5-bromo-4-chloroindolyl phosphate hydrolysis protein [Roseospira marina]